MSLDTDPDVRGVGFLLDYPILTLIGPSLVALLSGAIVAYLASVIGGSPLPVLLFPTAVIGVFALTHAYGESVAAERD